MERRRWNTEKLAVYLRLAPPKQPQPQRLGGRGQRALLVNWSNESKTRRQIVCATWSRFLGSLVPPHPLQPRILRGPHHHGPPLDPLFLLFGICDQSGSEHDQNHPGPTQPLDVFMQVKPRRDGRKDERQ